MKKDYKIITFVTYLALALSCWGEQPGQVVELIYSGKKDLLSYPKENLAKITSFQTVELIGDGEEIKVLRLMENLTHFSYGTDDAEQLTPDLIEFLVTRKKLTSIDLQLPIKRSEDLSFLAKMSSLKSLKLSRTVFSLSETDYLYDEKFASYLSLLPIERLVLWGGVEDKVVQKILNQSKSIKELRVSMGRNQLLDCLNNCEMGKLDYFEADCGGFASSEVSLINKEFDKHQVRITSEAKGIGASVIAKK